MTRIAAPQGRSVEEWIGATPDSKPPSSVLLRILRRDDHKCYLTGVPITPGMVYGVHWHAEHVKPLWAGGENRESNLRPALVHAHAFKTAEEAGARAKADRQAKAAYLPPPPAQKIQSRGFPKRERPSKIGKAKIEKQPVPRRGFYE
jgi:5-methylcytosine-specific restriction endonuclease McrA